MRVLLISPPYDRLKGIENNFFPPGLGYIASILEKQGHYVRIYNADMGPETSSFELFSARTRVKFFNNYIKNFKDDDFYVWKEIFEVVKEFKPDVVGITILSDAYGSALKTAQICKTVNPKIIVVAGGPHVTIKTNDVMKENEIDFCISGEGDYSFSKLLDFIDNYRDDFEKIEGLSFRKDGQKIISEKRAFVDDIENLPLPARQLVLRPELYSPSAMNFILASRGCPYRCTFCASAHIWGHKFKFRSVKSIIDEINEMIDKYDVVHFRFWDDTFTSIKQNVVDLCNALIESGINKKVHWNCLTRVNVIDDNLLVLLKKSGCTMIAIGVESGSPRILEYTKKGITLEQIRKAVKLIKKHKFMLHAYWMLGLPLENEEDIKATISFMKEINADGNLVNVLLPYPGTEIYDEVVSLGKISKEYDWKIPFYPYNGFTDIPQERFNELYEQMLSTAEILENKKTRLLKKAWVYRKSLLQNPLRIVKEIKKRVFK